MTDIEFALNTYWDDCLKVAKVNLYTGELIFIKKMEDEIDNGIADTPLLSDYTRSITENGLIHPLDVPTYLYQANIEMIRSRALVNKMKSSHTFRRKVGEVFIWLTFEITTPHSFSKDNPWAILTWRESDNETRVMEDALLMLSSIYHKILKINLTLDTHEEIKVYESEMNEQNGFSASSAEWLKQFALCGNVHETDIADYLKFTEITTLREHFKESKECIRFRYRRKTEGKFRWVCMEILPSLEYTDESQIVMLYIRDINDEYIAELQHQRELEYYCNTDTLTGLGNRYYYNNLCSIVEKHPEYSPIGVVFADVNGLKFTNDNFGHEKGDELIESFALRLAECFGKDKCCRISGDEFVVLAENVNEEDFFKKANAFKESLSQNGAEPPAAVGFAWTESVKTIKKTIADAETNMYADKQIYYNKYPHRKR